MPARRRGRRQRSSFASRRNNAVPLARSLAGFPITGQRTRKKRLPGRPQVAGQRDVLEARIEAALFLASEPLTSTQLARQAGVPPRLVPRLVRQLNERYRADLSSFYIRSVAGGWQLVVRPQLARWLARFRPPVEDLKLSNAAWETLTIIAYRQPIMRADIEAIRGVSCGDIIRQLIEKGLVRIVAYHNSLGRPALYGTTRYFLQVFGLPSLKHLPEAATLRRPAVDVSELRQCEASAQDSLDAQESTSAGRERRE